MRSRLVGAIGVAGMFSVCIAHTSYAAVIPAYFGMNFVDASATGFEVNLTSVTYIGEGGAMFTAAMPAFSGDVLNNPGTARTGLPDIPGLSGLPTYTNGGDGETTRTIGQSVSISWDTTSNPFPTIQIVSLTADALDFSGSWSADFTSPYTVGLIPFGADTELNSSLSGSQEDIYDAAIGTAYATSAPPAFSPLPEPSFFGTFTFSAAAVVPIPATVWLFGSGLLALIGISRRRHAV